MEALLVFKLPEEDVEHKTACAAGDMLAVLHELLEEMRRVSKHGTEEAAVVAAETWRKELLDLLRSRDLDWILNC